VRYSPFKKPVGECMMGSELKDDLQLLYSQEVPPRGREVTAYEPSFLLYLIQKCVVSKVCERACSFKGPVSDLRTLSIGVRYNPFRNPCT